jgi:hypothetical protein
MATSKARIKGRRTAQSRTRATRKARDTDEEQIETPVPEDDPCPECYPAEDETPVVKELSESTLRQRNSEWWRSIGGTELRKNSSDQGKYRARWTPEEDRLVMSPKHSNAEIAWLLGRTYYAVSTRRVYLTRQRRAATGTKAIA